ncbi:hypothetical protein COCSADRAFT_104018 [Bipolaris sorokiniana ND90Pr]|nr:uncharacterized protein COCSADRAFT_104018 [Bipolaris sorokiniana ND90Pr]EMD58418.1 hypothetical protein COCSADRAFT_104018 [Bipolaris sorokiniana ND90Pr]
MLTLLGQLRTLTTRIEAYLSQTSKTPASTEDREFDTLRNEYLETINNTALHLTHPLEYWSSIRGACADTAVFRCANEFELFQRIPLTGTATSTSLAAAVGVDTGVLTRVLRLLSARGCFQEVSECTFAHTPFSAFVQEHPHFASFLRATFEVFGGSAATLPDSLLAPVGENGARPSAFEVRFGEGCYEFWAKQPEKLARFQRGLHEPLLLHEINESYNWDDVKGTIVDIGGGEGQVARCLAEHFEHLKFLVQDTFVKEDVIAGIARGGLADRLRFEVHDYFTPQKSLDQGAFFLKHCLHNNDDENCVRILKAIAPAMESSGPETRLIIAENVLPEWNDTSLSRQQRVELFQDDISMLQLFNAKKRSAAEYQELLHQADPRLRIFGIHRPPRGQLCCIDVRLSA